MKTISNFEILFNRIAPIQGSNPNIGGNSIARRVVQAHFLSITNLEYNRPVYFSVSYITNNLSPDDVNRELITTPANFSLIYDGSGVNNRVLQPTEYQLSTAIIPPFPFKSYATLKTTSLVVFPGETALLALFPNFIPSLGTLSPSIEIRGHISIKQEANGVVNNVLETNPFVNEPAKLLICSEHRGTFLDNDFNGSRTEITLNNGINIGFDFDQLVYALPLAEGKSLYTLDGV